MSAEEIRVFRRTFEATKHPKGSPERARLNESVETSEYMPSHRYGVTGPHFSQGCRTKGEAEQIRDRR
jgi:hypothetical protein